MLVVVRGGLAGPNFIVSLRSCSLLFAIAAALVVSAVLFELEGADVTETVRAARPLSSLLRRSK
jgi:hypothetical protein